MISSDLIRGHLESIILKLILEKDRYGYEISKEINARTNSKFQIKEATLYAVFQRLQKKKLIEYYYGDETQGGRRKYYRITTLGKEFYLTKVDEWEETKDIIDIFLSDKVDLIKGGL